MTDIDRSKFQREVTLPFTGQKFLIRRVRFKEFILKVGGLPLQLNRSVQEIMNNLREKAEAGDSATEDNIMRCYISKGVVSPKVWLGPEGECPADQVYYEDLGNDLDTLVTEIINYSNGLSVISQLDEFFREPGTGAAGPNGTEVQPAPVDPAAGTDV